MDAQANSPAAPGSPEHPPLPSLLPLATIHIHTDVTSGPSGPEQGQTSALPCSSPSYSLLHQSVTLSIDLELETISGSTEITLSCISLSSIDVFRLNARGLDISSVKLDGVIAKYTLRKWSRYTDESVGGIVVENIEVALQTGGKDLRSRFTPEMVADMHCGELLIYNPLFSTENSDSSSNNVAHTLLQIEYSTSEPTSGAVAFNAEPRSLVISCMPEFSQPSQYWQSGTVPANQPLSSNLKPATQLSTIIPSCIQPEESVIRGFARHWLPCFDTLHDRATWDFSFHVVPPDVNLSIDDQCTAQTEINSAVDFEVFCSGTRISNESCAGVVSFHVSDPISAPLISIVVAERFSRHSTILQAETWDPDANFREIAVIAPRSHASLLPHAAYILPALFHFFSETFGPYPFTSFGTHTVAFLENIPSSPGPSQGGAGVTLLDVSWLCPSDAFDRTIELRRMLMQSIAFQWFGCWVVPKTSLDHWCVMGLGQFMAAQFYRHHFGLNEFRYRLKKDIQRLAVLDIKMPPLHYWPQSSTDFLLLKSALVVYMLDKRMAKVSASCGITSCITKILSSRMLSSNGLQRWIRRESSIDGLRSLWSQWVDNVGVPKIELVYSQNIGRQVIEFDMTQSNSSQWGRQAGVSPNIFSGSITVLISELDGVVYSHSLDFSRSTEHFEVRFNSRYKFKKLMARTGAALATKSFEDKWAASIKDDDDSDPYRWIQWVFVDHDVEWPILVFLRQPDPKWALLFQHSMSVISQFEVVSHLAQCPTMQSASLLFKIAQDPRIFCRIRCNAITALVGTARPQFQWVGLEYLMKFLEKYTTTRSSQLLDLLPNLLKFESFQEYLIFRTALCSLCSIKDETFISPMQIKRLILRFLESYDHEISLGINHAEFLGFLIKCLCNVMLPVPLAPNLSLLQIKGALSSQTQTNIPSKKANQIVPEVLDMGFGYLSDSENEVDEQDATRDRVPASNSWGKFQLEFRSDEHFLEEVMNLFERIRVEELLTTQHPEVICKCIECLCQWMMAGLLDKNFGFFLECSDQSYQLMVRQAAFQALVLLHGYFEMPIALYLLHVVQFDCTFNIRKSIAHFFLATARLLGAPEKASTTERKKILLRTYKALTLQLLPRIRDILEDEKVSPIIHEFLLDWIDLVLSPPVIRVRVKCSIPPPLVVESRKEALPVSIAAVGRSWQPPYTGIQPIQRLGPVGSSMLNAGNFIIESLKMHSSAPPFLYPVAPGVPGYYDIITDPMDLQCVDRRLKNLHYQRLEDMFSDVDKIFKNYKLFNEKDTAIWVHGECLEQYFENEVKPRARRMMPETLPMTITEDQLRKIRKIMKLLRGKIFSGPFLKPVCGVPQYYDIISNPMDLGTVRRKVECREYPNIAEFERDMLLVLKNCFKFNAPGDAVYESGKELEAAFLKEWKREFPSASRGSQVLKSAKCFFEFESSGRELSAYDGLRQRQIDIDDSLGSKPVAIANGKRFQVNSGTGTISFRELHGIIVSHEDSFDFLVPVDPVALNLPTYTSIIKNPMDLQTIGHRLHTYSSERELFNDLLLMLRNSITFNKPKTPAYESSFHLYTFIQRQWQRFFNVGEFPPLLAHPLEKKSSKKPNVNTSSASFLIKNAVIFRPPRPPKPQISRPLPSRINVTSLAVSSSPVSPQSLLSARTPQSPMFPSGSGATARPPPIKTFSSAMHSMRNGTSVHSPIKTPNVPFTTLTEQSFESTTPRHGSSASRGLSGRPPSSPAVRRSSAPPKPQARKMTPACSERITRLLKKIFESKLSGPFLRPVDPVGDGVPQYFEFITKPMDFGTIRQKHEAHEYETLEQFDEDVQQVFQNCSTFNGREHILTKQAGNLKSLYNSEWKSVGKTWQQSYKQELKKVSALELPFDAVTAKKIVNRLRKSPHAKPFLKPVDPIAQFIPTYFDVVKSPMDLLTVYSKIERVEYNNMMEYLQDVQLVFENCFKFNNPGDPVYIEGQKCQRLLDMECRKFNLNPGAGWALPTGGAELDGRLKNAATASSFGGVCGDHFFDLTNASSPLTATCSSVNVAMTPESSQRDSFDAMSCDMDGDGRDFAILSAPYDDADECENQSGIRGRDRSGGTTPPAREMVSLDNGLLGGNLIAGTKRVLVSPKNGRVLAKKLKLKFGRPPQP